MRTSFSTSHHRMAYLVTPLLALGLGWTVTAQDNAETQPEASAPSYLLTGRLIENSEFEAWDGETPVGWSVTTSGFTSRPKERHNGSAVMRATPNPEKDYLVFQRHENPSLLDGDTVVFEVEAEAESPGDLRVMIWLVEAGENGKKNQYVAVHPGGGWQTLRVFAPVPDGNYARLDLLIEVPQAATRPSTVASARGFLVPEVP